MTDEPTGTDPAATKTAELSCAGCGEIVFPSEDFCENCGRRLREGAAAPAGGPGPARREGATTKQYRGGADPARACAHCASRTIDAEGYCGACGMRQPAERDHVEITVPAGAAGVSDRGRRYARNEDALALTGHATGVAAVVSDGVGSSQRPEEASRAAADTGAAELAARLDAGTDPQEATRLAALKAAAAVAALAGSPGEAPSCTYVSAVVHGGAVTVGWIGDSRVYWIAAQEPPEDAADAGVEADTADLAELTGSAQLTEDDSWAAFMVAEGALTEAEAEAHPNAHVITAWLGADAGEVHPHVRTYRPSGPGTLLVCSDGLWNYFPAPAALAALVDGSADALGTARTLVRHALDAGGRDNITVAVIPLPTPSTEQPR
ncbi:PP2C family protein-serine/threonine phosphatase [Spirillospora albida]|uniref:PP2C family protein-serine/threonine phosphatase n=1 Tax=Spirillospora albida TaxID=58123 RepID=UPI0004BF1C15|nr:protein phosphatase 2C domain-containing protein [Spirillospora albida]